jgi:hypothetical protein
LALGRFGRLSMKERRAWHNFANPFLRGDVSPNQGNVWRCVDSCQIAGVLGFAASTNAENDPVIVVEVRGDAFLPQQVRRIIGTALAMTHGWIPSSPADGSQTLWSPECVMETPLAPPGRLYLAKCRFHYEEGRNSGQSIFVTDSGGKAIDAIPSSSSPEDEAPLAWTQRWIQQNRSNPAVQHVEQQWLTELQEQIAPRMTQSLASFSSAIPSSLKGDGSVHGVSVSTTSNVIVTNQNNTFPQQPAPLEFKAVLEKLRAIVRDGRWPDTSVARSTVIRGLPTSTRRQDDSNKARTNNGGSFTVINTKLLLEDNTTTTTTNVPLGNELFPDLVQAVFELEEAIANQAKIVEVSKSNGKIVTLPSRQEVSSSPLHASSSTKGQDPEQKELLRPRPFASSTHCAINANAQFKPHVDSGRGAGQSRSIIVGLGDYTQGGELIVEGNYFDIRYQPLEFDGWTLRHWTNLFQGERFSLVWFTPAPTKSEMNLE